MIPLLAAVVVLQLLFRFGLPYIWSDGIRWWGGNERFWYLSNQINIAEQISINAILAFGMTLTILIGGIDLSVGALLALVGTTTAFILAGANTQDPLLLTGAILGGLGMAAVFGAFNGLCAARTRMPPFIITLATMLIARGAALRFNENQTIPIPACHKVFLALGSGRLFGEIPVPVIVMATIFILTAILLHRTRFGQHVYAIGGNREAARFTGIPVVRIEIFVYMICSILAGIAGMIAASQLSSARPEVGVGFELNAIAAAVVGGTSFTGGRGVMVGTLIGAIIIGILNKGLNQAGVHFSLQYIVKGLVILAAVYIDVRRRK